MTGNATDSTAATLPDSTHVGRVALRVNSLDATVPFYRDVVGLDGERDDEAGEARLSAGGEELVVLEEDAGAPERPHEAAGLFHLAVRVPDRPALAAALARVRAHGSLAGASDHAVSEALYLRDPEGNGVEIYRDRPREEWQKTATGTLVIQTLPLDLDDLAAARSGAAADGRDADRVPTGTDVGHVHLEVGDLDRAIRFYVDDVGFALQNDEYDGAAFVAAGGYHHHLGLNTWNRRTAPSGDHCGLAWYELVLPDESSLAALRDRLTGRGYSVEAADGGFHVADPDGIAVRVRVE
ncbi:VOC family protein [Haloarchaeobius sp. DT45]|uniref:VOC family protein n=1 Tax=Haloarchaeobius sp. DT45 TaxID=3446116 RepID=UPI003F6B82FC